MSSILSVSEFLGSELPRRPFACVLGNPISQSLSPVVHNAGFRFHNLDITYHAVLVPDNEHHHLANLFKMPMFRGCSVTLPLKERVIEELDISEADVLQTKACNLIWRNKDRLLCGDNTDIAGFLSPLQAHVSAIIGGTAMIFGSGGASRSAIYGLKKMGIRKVYQVSRNPRESSDPVVESVSYRQWPEKAPSADLFINCTPLGMVPNIDTSVVDDGNIQLLRDKICYDMVYRPLKTKFLQQAESVGALAIDGTAMFLGQAAPAFEKFSGHPFPLEVARKALFDVLYS